MKRYCFAFVVLFFCFIFFEVSKGEGETTGTDAPVLAAILQENMYALDLALESGADPNQVVSGWSALHAACSRGNLEWVKKLLQYSADPDIRNHNGRVPMMEAIAEGHSDIVKELLFQGANPNAKDESGNTPLQLACTLGNFEIASVLISGGADVSFSNQQGASPLFYASAFGHLQIVELLIRNGANPNIQTKEGFTPLFEAAISGNIQLVEMLLQHGVPANSKTSDGWTPLHNAAKHGHVQVIELLLNNNAEVNAIETRGHRTPLFLACSDGNADAVVLLLDNGADPNIKADSDITPLHIAVTRENMIMVNSLLDTGADVNCRDKEGTTPLSKAAHTGNNAITRVLLEHSADPNIGTYANRFYPILIASARGANDVVKSLVEFGADIRLTSFERTTALHAAAMSGHSNIVEFLLSKGANPNIVDSKGWSTIHNAIQGGSIDVIRVLLDNGVDPNLSHNGIVPITLAAVLNHPKIVYLLAQRGANVNIKDAAGWTPVLHISGAGQAESLSILLNHGGDVSVRNNEGQSAIQVAQLHGHHDEILHILAKAGADLDDIDVNAWLNNIGFSNLINIFEENSITGSVFPYLTKSLLKSDLGIVKVGELVKLDAALKPFREVASHYHDEL